MRLRVVPEDEPGRPSITGSGAAPWPPASPATLRAFICRPHSTGPFARARGGRVKAGLLAGAPGRGLWRRDPHGFADPPEITWHLEPSPAHRCRANNRLTRIPCGRKPGAKTFYLINASPFKGDPITLPTLWTRRCGQRALGGTVGKAVAWLSLAFSVGFNTISLHRL